MPLFNTFMGGSTPETLVTPDGITDSIAIEKVDGKTVKPSSTLGNATAEKVLKGYTFTSDNGFCIPGTSTLEETLKTALFLKEKETLGDLPSWSLSYYYTEAAYGNDIYIVISDSPQYCAFKEPGKSWLIVGPGSSSAGEGSIAFGNGYFVLAECDLTSNNMNRNRVFRTSDARAWSNINLPNNIPRGKVIFAKNKFFLFPGPQQNISNTLISTDGGSWSTASVSNGGTSSTGVVTYDEEQGIFYRVKNGVFLSSTDGLNWTKKYTFTTGNPNNEEFICAGNGTVAYRNRGLTSGYIYYDNFTKSKAIYGFSPNKYFNGFFICPSSLTNGLVSIVPAYYVEGSVDIITIPLPGTVPEDTLNASHVVVANDVAFTGSQSVTYYSANLLFWSRDKIVYFADSEDNDVTMDVFEKLSFISEDTLKAAYTLGVNSYA